MMNVKKVKKQFTVKDAVTNIMQSVHEVIELSKSIEFKKSCLDIFGVHDFEDLKVESSKKLTKLLTKRHSRHNKLVSSSKRSSNIIAIKEKDILSQKYSPIRKRHRSEPLTSFPKIDQSMFFNKSSSTRTEKLQDVSTSINNENALDVSIISDFMNSEQDNQSFEGRSIKNCDNLKKEEQTSSLNTESSISLLDNKIFDDIFAQKITLTPELISANRNQISSPGQVFCGLHKEIQKADSFIYNCSDNSFEDLDDLSLFHQCQNNENSRVKTDADFITETYLPSEEYLLSCEDLKLNKQNSDVTVKTAHFNSDDWINKQNDELWSSTFVFPTESQTYN